MKVTVRQEMLIHPDGRIEIRVIGGVRGPACLAVGKQLAAALGETTSVVRTGAYYGTESVQTTPTAHQNLQVDDNVQR